MKQNSERVVCGDRLRGCGGELTEADLEAGCCTQCKTLLVAPEFGLEHQLLQSLAEVQSRRDAEVAE